MKDNFVSNTEQILIANQTQKNKIEFLQRERIKREHYLDDLQQNLLLNKATLREMNELGPNVQAISKLIQQADVLRQKLKGYYEEYQNINAVLLMQKQMRLEDKKFYNERMIQFENKIVDLRKYLHDKEDSFSSVVTRLKKYEEIAESTMDDKLVNYKKEIGERHINQFISEILKEKSFYLSQYEKIKKQFIVFSELKSEIVANYPEVQNMINSYQAIHKTKIMQIISDSYHSKINEQSQQKQKKQKRYKIDPNKELIRLLKKQKLSKELHEDALHEAIQKNEQLISIKQVYERSLQKMQRKCSLLFAQNTIFALRLAEYDTHYCRYATHSKRYYEQGEHQGLRVITEKRLRQYGMAVRKYFQSEMQMRRQFTERLKEQVQNWGQFICDSNDVRKQLDKKHLITKSCSVPHLIVQFDLDEFQQNGKMIIEQF